MTFFDWVPLTFSSDLQNVETTDIATIASFLTYTSNMTQAVIPVPEAMKYQTVLSYLFTLPSNL